MKYLPKDCNTVPLLLVIFCALFLTFCDVTFRDIVAYILCMSLWSRWRRQDWSGWSVVSGNRFVIL